MTDDKTVGQWSAAKAWEWYNHTPWIRGFGTYPSNCVNRIAMWQSYRHAEVFAEIDREFALAKDTGFNAVRAVLQFEVWNEEHDSFMANLEEYFTLADRYGLKVMLVLGNDCTVAKSRWKPVRFGEQPVDWGYHSGIKGGQHAGDYTEPGYQLLDDPAIKPRYYEMVAELAEKYGQDDRLQIWDVWNEPGNSNRENMSMRDMEAFFTILREHNVKQPLTADVWSYDDDGKPLFDIQLRAMELSDVVTFHCYKNYGDAVRIIAKLRELTDRPLICNEWLDRYEGNDVEHMFPLFWLLKIGCYHWGLVQGYSQTYEPWGFYFMRQQNGEDLDLTRWQHDIYRFNGLPYIPKEIEIFRKYAALADKQD